MTGELKADEFIPADFARDLERRLAAVRYQLKLAQMDAVTFISIRERLMAELATERAERAILSELIKKLEQAL